MPCIIISKLSSWHYRYAPSLDTVSMHKLTIPEAILCIAETVAKHIEALPKGSRSMTKRHPNFTDIPMIRMLQSLWSHTQTE